jgi:hypothetical protein
MKLRGGNFVQPQVGPSLARMLPDWVRFAKMRAPLAVMLRSIAAEPERRRFHGPSPLRCVRTFGMRAPQDEDD